MKTHTGKHSSTRTHSHTHSSRDPDAMFAADGLHVKSVSIIAKVMAKVQLWVQVNKNYSNMQNTMQNEEHGVQPGALVNVCVSQVHKFAC